MLHPFQHITDLSEICYRNGVQYVVISPGSRNAPLIDAFFSRFQDRCYSIVDERSAGYFALGIARYLQSPVVLICTSGTAVLNYSPALAEAYYSQIPLLAITADRPAEWIDQQDNQTIRQKEVYKNFIKKSYYLPERIENTRLLNAFHRQMYDAFSCTSNEPKGPVHLNVPINEPLYTEIPVCSKNISLPASVKKSEEIHIPDELKTAWQNAEKIFIVHGQDRPHSEVREVLSILSERPGIVVIAENISNIKDDKIISHTDLLFAHNNAHLLQSPDLLLYSGGQVVSRRLKNYLRNLKSLPTWRIGIDDYPMDTFKQKNRILSVSPANVYKQLLHMKQVGNAHSDFRENWHHASAHAMNRREELIRYVPFSDVLAMKIILDALPGGSILELGNSSVVRMYQFFNYPGDIEIFSNRGVSGIDGCLSAAVGTASISNKITLAIIGDLSFIYDSNALWNRRLPPNLRVIVLNNEGGGIFSVLEGPSSKPAYEDFFIAYHPVNMQKLAEAFNLHYFCADDEQSLVSELSRFFQPAGKAGVLEIKTKRQNNVQAFQMILGKNVSSNKQKPIT